MQSRRHDDLQAANHLLVLRWLGVPHPLRQSCTDAIVDQFRTERSHVDNSDPLTLRALMLLDKLGQIIWING
jgi:hypothetical protein